MPHYADGKTIAVAGDLVFGRPDDPARPVTGEVVCVETDRCMVHVACPIVHTVGQNQDLPLHGLYFGPQNEPYGTGAEVIIGRSGCFSLLHRGPQPPAEVTPDAPSPEPKSDSEDIDEQSPEPSPEPRPERRRPGRPAKIVKPAAT